MSGPYTTVTGYLTPFQFVLLFNYLNLQKNMDRGGIPQLNSKVERKIIYLRGGIWCQIGWDIIEMIFTWIVGWIESWSKYSSAKKRWSAKCEIGACPTLHWAKYFSFINSKHPRFHVRPSTYKLNDSCDTLLQEQNTINQRKNLFLFYSDVSLNWVSWPLLPFVLMDKLVIEGRSGF